MDLFQSQGLLLTEECELFGKRGLRALLPEALPLSRIA
jgi:hypothetical protein